MEREAEIKTEGRKERGGLQSRGLFLHYSHVIELIWTGRHFLPFVAHLDSSFLN